MKNNRLVCLLTMFSIIFPCFCHGDSKNEINKELSVTNQAIHDVFEVMSKINGSPMKSPNAYDITSMMGDFDGNGEVDVLIECINSRGGTGNRDFALFCSINNKFKYVGGFANIVKTIKYINTGNAYIIDIGHAGDIGLGLNKIKNGVIEWKSQIIIHDPHDEGQNATSKDMILLKNITEYVYDEKDLLKIFGK